MPKLKLKIHIFIQWYIFFQTTDFVSCILHDGRFRGVRFQYFQYFDLLRWTGHSISVIDVCTVLFIGNLRFVSARNNHSNKILFLNQLTWGHQSLTLQRRNHSIKWYTISWDRFCYFNSIKYCYCICSFLYFDHIAIWSGFMLF